MYTWLLRFCLQQVLCLDSSRPSTRCPWMRALRGGSDAGLDLATYASFSHLLECTHTLEVISTSSRCLALARPAFGANIMEVEAPLRKRSSIKDRRPTRLRPASAKLPGKGYNSPNSFFQFRIVVLTEYPGPWCTCSFSLRLNCFPHHCEATTTTTQIWLSRSPYYSVCSRLASRTLLSLTRPHKLRRIGSSKVSFNLFPSPTSQTLCSSATDSVTFWTAEQLKYFH